MKNDAVLYMKDRHVLLYALASDQYSFSRPLSGGSPVRFSHFALGSEQPGSIMKSKGLGGLN